MTKDSINNIIAHNRRPFAVHQLWAEFDKLERANKAMTAALRTCTKRKTEGYDDRGMRCWRWEYSFDEAKVNTALPLANIRSQP